MSGEYKQKQISYNNDIEGRLNTCQNWSIPESSSAVEDSFREPKFSVLAKTVKCALGLSHGNADNERSLPVNKKTLSKERSGLSIVTLNGL